jgi:hypothetical protein
MSFWGATVITSLATVIPVVGKHIVYWLWGGFTFFFIKKASVYSDIEYKILFNAGTSLFIYSNKNVRSYILNLLNILEPKGFSTNTKHPLKVMLVYDGSIHCMYRMCCSLGSLGSLGFLGFLAKVYLRFQKNVKTDLGYFKNNLSSKVNLLSCYFTQAKSAGLFRTAFMGLDRFLLFTTKINQPYSSQRLDHFLVSGDPIGVSNTLLTDLNTEDLIWLVGFVEGDGCFSVNKNGKYVKYEFSIEVSIRDIQLLYKIKKLLKVGSITTRTRKNGSKISRFKISSKPDLMSFILPIFSKYQMLSSKNKDFFYFKNCLDSGVVFYKDLPVYKKSTEAIYSSVEDLLKVPYFDSWLVGFIEAEGCFSTYHASGEKNKTSSFSIAQTHEKQLMEALQKKFKLNSKVNEKIDSEISNNISYSIATTSSHGVQNVLNFFKNARVKLKGYKKAQYYKWLHELRANARYSKVKIPNHY